MKKLSNYVIFFFLYAVVGWIYEVLLELLYWGNGFVNRGVLFGPWLPVYGFGALLFIFLIYPLIKDKSKKRKLIMIPVVFLGCMVVATALELLTSYLCEAVMGYWPWQTYKDYAINFQGRIALSPSIRFGLGGAVFLYLLQPLFEKLCDKFGDRKHLIAIIIVVVLVLDLIYSFTIR